MYWGMYRPGTKLQMANGRKTKVVKKKTDGAAHHKTAECGICHTAGEESQAATVVQSALRRYLMRRPRECFACCEDMPVGFFEPMIHVRAAKGQAKAPCDSCCMRCFRTHFSVRVEASEASVACPSCAHALADSMELRVCRELNERLRVNRAAGVRQEIYLAELRAGLGAPEFLEWANKHARVCPACKVLVWRDGGCSDMECVCGQDFDWSDTFGTRLNSRTPEMLRALVNIKKCLPYG